MKTPVCEICLRSGLLCRSCEEKVQKGEVSRAVVDVSSLLMSIAEEKKQLRDVTIADVLDSPEITVIICGKGDAPKLIGASGQNVRKLEEELKKRVKVVEQAKDPRQFAANLLKPVPVASVNKVYKEGKEMYRINLKRGKSPISARGLSWIFRTLYGKDAEIAKG